MIVILLTPAKALYYIYTTQVRRVWRFLLQ